MDIKSDPNDRNFHALEQIFCLPFITVIIIIIRVTEYSGDI